jgi:hypothetical protein
VEIIESIKDWFKKEELGSLFLLTKSTKMVLEAIQEKGFLHQATLQFFHSSSFNYYYSSVFFKQTAPDEVSEKVLELLKIANDIRKALGFDESHRPFVTKNIEDIFRKIHMQILALKKKPITTALVKQLDDLDVSIGKLIAVAAVDGDRPVAFEQGDRVSEKITNLYPVLEVLQVGDLYFDEVLEIRGLNETYALYSQIEKRKKGREE